MTPLVLKSSRKRCSTSGVFILSALCAVSVLFSTGHAQQLEDVPSETNTMQSIEQFKAGLDSIMSEISAPGAAVAIVSGDSVVWIGTFGLENIASGEPVTEETRFCIGSCTKSFTGLGFLKLLDEGRVDLDMPVREIVPEIEIDNPWAYSDPVRIVNLLEHTSGFDDSHPNWFYLDRPALTLKQALERKAHLRKVRWQPGTRFGYSSAGFTLAGYIMEKISGQRYEDYIRDELLVPVGMENTTIGYYHDGIPDAAIGYDRNIEPVPRLYDYDVPAGAIYSSIKDMALFVQFLLNRGAAEDRQIISDRMFDRIGHPVSTLAARSGLESGYSFGIGTRYKDGTKWHGHSGGVPGFVSEYYYNVESGLGFVVLQNSFGIMFDSDMFDRVWEYAISRVDSVSLPSRPVQCGQVRSYSGYYLPRSPRMQLAAFMELLTGGVTVLCENDTLYTRGFLENRSPLIHVSGNLFRRPGQPEATIVFAKDDDGNMIYASQSSYYERSPVWITYLHRFFVFGALILMMSSIAYALIWIPVHIYKKLRRRRNRSKYITMRLVPLLAVVSLILGIIPMQAQTMLGLGLMTPPNVVFFISTLIFAALSTFSLFTAYRSFHKPVKMVARVYAVLVSSACFGMTLYLGYWGLIGLSLWAY
jgi:CubicO group peptidase (beta-lactamase class C family)